MAIYQVTLPKMGESVLEATVTAWVVSEGDRVKEDDSLVEIATDKVDSDVPSPVSGVVKKILFQEGDVVQVGETLIEIEVEGEDVGGSSPLDSIAIASNQEDQEENLPEEESSGLEEEVIIDDLPGLDQLAMAEVEDGQDQFSSDRFYSPLVKSIAKEEGISAAELDRIKGSGVEGRLTKNDILSYLENKYSKPADPRGVIERNNPEKELGRSHKPPVKDSSVSAVSASSGDEIIEMDRMRRLIANHMVHSVQTSPHVASFVEADVTSLVNWRNEVKEEFKKREGENITFTPIFIEAISKALRDYPLINVSVDGYKIIKKKSINIGMATALPSGNLIVPVIHNADQLSLVGLTRAVNSLSSRARENKLTPDEISGGTFTFTNIGAFGNIMGVPIINQPQAAILAVGTIKKKPAVIETPEGDFIGIRHMVYLSLSYDHRVIDGALGGMFLKRVGEYLENWNTAREI
ncbi:MAG TPA: dihydrolipoamide acetyltransferase family protein [Candidatus Sphingobacterium stercoripullorum]|nr:dihydrolipoamide acetyltransferase family protein [Candidatus Sphingobacterium stercoripullorum]